MEASQKVSDTVWSETYIDCEINIPLPDFETAFLEERLNAHKNGDTSKSNRLTIFTAYIKCWSNKQVWLFMKYSDYSLTKNKYNSFTKSHA